MWVMGSMHSNLSDIPPSLSFSLSDLTSFSSISLTAQIHGIHLLLSLYNPFKLNSLFISLSSLSMAFIVTEELFLSLAISTIVLLYLLLVILDSLWSHGASCLPPDCCFPSLLQDKGCLSTVRSTSDNTTAIYDCWIAVMIGSSLLKHLQGEQLQFTKWVCSVEDLRRFFRNQ